MTVIINGSGSITGLAVLSAGYAAFNVAGPGFAGNLPANVYTKMTMTTEDYDPDSVFDAANSRFVVPVAGVYEFTVKPARSNVAESISAGINLYKNGVAFNQIWEATGVWSTITATVALKLTAGDIIELYFSPGASTTTAFSGIRLQGKLLRAL